MPLNNSNLSCVRYPVDLSVPLCVPAELDDSDKHGERQSTQQHHKHTTWFGEGWE